LVLFSDEAEAEVLQNDDLFFTSGLGTLLAGSLWILTESGICLITSG
jgi:hypothetical protein